MNQYLLMVMALVGGGCAENFADIKIRYPDGIVDTMPSERAIASAAWSHLCSDPKVLRCLNKSQYDVYGMVSKGGCKIIIRLHDDSTGRVGYLQIAEFSCVDNYRLKLDYFGKYS